VKDRFERLLDTDATETERALLDSASDDVPSAHARSSTLAAMGVGAGALIGASHAAHAATKLVATGAASGATKGAGAVSALLLLKWVGTGAVVGSVVAAAVATATTPGLIFSKRAVRASGEPAAVVQATPSRPGLQYGGAAAALPAPAPDRAQIEASKHVHVPPPERADRPASVVGAGDTQLAVVASPPAPSPAEARPASSVAAEVASLDRARSALAAGDAREALVRLSAHDAAFATGALQPEAVVLRVRALIAVGERGRAAEVANRFIAAHPESAQTGPLRALIGAR
jgi:hypothetical protein